MPIQHQVLYHSQTLYVLCFSTQRFMVYKTYTVHIHYTYIPIQFIGMYICTFMNTYRQSSRKEFMIAENLFSLKSTYCTFFFYTLTTFPLLYNIQVHIQYIYISHIYVETKGFTQAHTFFIIAFYMCFLIFYVGLFSIISLWFFFILGVECM